MQLETPSEVAIAVRMLIAIWITIFQVSLFIDFYFLEFYIIIAAAVRIDRDIEAHVGLALKQHLSHAVHCHVEDAADVSSGIHAAVRSDVLGKLLDGHHIGVLRDGERILLIRAQSEGEEWRVKRRVVLL